MKGGRGREEERKQASTISTGGWIMIAWYMEYSGVNLNSIKIIDS